MKKISAIYQMIMNRWKKSSENINILNSIWHFVKNVLTLLWCKNKKEKWKKKNFLALASI